MNKTVKTFEGELELGHLDMLVAASARDVGRRIAGIGRNR